MPRIGEIVGKSGVPVTGTKSIRTVSSHFGDVVNVKDYGAVGDGLADDTAAVQEAFAFARTLTNGAIIYFPKGKYLLSSLTSTTPLRVFSKLTIRGDGMNNTMITWNDEAGIHLIAGPSSGRAQDVVIEDISLRGNWDTKGNASCYPILIYNTDNLMIRRILIEYSRVFALAVRSSKGVTVTESVIRFAGRDGINLAQCSRYTITDNIIEHCDDDAIAAHTDTGDPEGTPNLGVIAGNRVFDAQGIKVLGARHLTISGNSLDCVKAQGITVSTVTHDGVASEGVSSTLNVAITGNKITNVLDRTAIDALNANNPYIFITGSSAQKGTLAAIPGDNDTTTGTIVEYYDNLKANGKATTVPTPGTNGIVVSGNIMSRTLKGGVLFSSYGRGQIFQRGGWYDPTFTDHQMGNDAIIISGNMNTNILISDNIISGLSTALNIPGGTRQDNIVFKDNICWDISGYGILLNNGSSARNRVYVEGNVFDMDPLVRHASRGANGTWTSETATPTAIQFQSASGAIVKNNIFKNAVRVTSHISFGNGRWEGNLVEADATTIGSFSTSNKGVGNIPREANVIHTDCDPASATFGKYLTYGYETSSTIPSTGKYTTGTFIRNNSSTPVSGGKLTLGWYRLTTGTGHVAGTDWLVVQTMDSTYVPDVSSSAITTSTGVTRTITSMLTATHDIRNYGAVGNGTTDDGAAIQKAIDAAFTAGGGIVLIPAGTFRKGKGSAQLVMKSNVTLQGVGDASIIYFDDNAATGRNDFMTCSNASNIQFRDFQLLGNHDLYYSNTNISQGITGSNCNNVVFKNVTFRKLRFMSTAFSYSHDIRFEGCLLDACHRDGIRFTGCWNVSVVNNILRNLADDCLAFHNLDSATHPLLGSGYNVVGNIFEACQGVKFLGAKVFNVVGNQFRRMTNGVINIAMEAVEGSTPEYAINISDNIIHDTVGNWGNNFGIYIEGLPRSKADLTGNAPGVSASVFPYNNLNDIDAANKVNIGSWGITINNNIFARTLPNGVAWSDFGTGLFHKFGIAPDNPISSDSMFAIHTIQINTPVNGLRITNNQFYGQAAGYNTIWLNSQTGNIGPDYTATVIENNTFFDCPNLNINVTAGGSNIKDIIIRNNIFDCDPYFRNGTHSADNTWTDINNVIPIAIGNTYRQAIIDGNTFKNCGQAVNDGGGGIVMWGTNYVYADVIGVGNNAANKGVRNCPRDRNFIYIQYDADPLSATYGTILTTPAVQAAAMPSAGKYVQGHYVRNNSPAVLAAPNAKRTLIGWTRLTTSNTHVSGTDWAPLYALNDITVSGQFVDVKDFGAKGDGVTIDNTAISNAINSGKAVYFPAATYLVNTIYQLNDNVIFAGDAGKSVLLRNPTATTTSVLDQRGTGFYAEGLVFDGNKDNITTAPDTNTVTVHSDSKRATFHRCTFTGAKGTNTTGTGHGALVVGDEALDSRFQFTECTFRNNQADGLVWWYADNVVVTDSHSYSNGRNGISCDFGDPAVVKTNNRFKIINNHIYQNGSTGIAIGNFNQNNGGTVLYSHVNPDALTGIVQGNHVYNNATYGIGVYGDYLLVMGNNVHDNNTSNGSAGGIVFSARYSICSDNIVYRNSIVSGYGIDSGGAANSIIKGNIIHNNYIGLNPGGSVGVICSHNNIHSNIATGIYVIPTEGGGGTTFPYYTQGLVITDNIIGLNIAGRWGVQILHGTEVEFSRNHFFLSGTATVQDCMNWNGHANSTMFGNVWSGKGDSRTFNPDGSGIIRVPDFQENIIVTNASATVNTITSWSKDTIPATAVAYVTPTAVGSGYTTATVAFSGGGGTGAAATAKIWNGTVYGIHMTSHGSGYTSAPTVTITGDGTGATAQATLGCQTPTGKRLTIMFNGGGTLAHNPGNTNTSGRALTVGTSGFIELVGVYGGYRVSNHTGNIDFAEIKADGEYVVKSQGIADITVIPANKLAVRGTMTQHLGTTEIRRSSLASYTTTGSGFAYLTSDGTGTPTTNNIISVAPNSARYVKGEVIGRAADTGETAHWNFTALIKNNGTSVSIPGSSTSFTKSYGDANTAWVVSMVPDTTLGGGKLSVSGEASRTISWTAKIDTILVS